MIAKARMLKKVLRFKTPAVTSRNVFQDKTSYLVFLTGNDGCTGIGECSPLHLLSPDNLPSLPSKIEEVLLKLNRGISPGEVNFDGYPSLRFAVESALLDLEKGGRGIYYDNAFTQGRQKLKINGLVWMSDIEEMFESVGEKVKEGYTCIKMKIGSQDFGAEIGLLKKIRGEFGNDVEIRLDANGAFSVEEADEKLNKLSAFNIHSIEQPIMPGNLSELSGLCASSPIPIALDEELISVPDEKIQWLLGEIRPAYVIIKPTLLGGLSRSEEWIVAARQLGIGWWATSALEGNIGLQAIAQWCAGQNPEIPQGLGTGSLFTTNFPSGLRRSGELLDFDPGFNRNPAEIELM